MSLLEVLTPQPNFPDEDLREKNAAHVEFYLRAEPGVVAYERDLRASMRTLHTAGHNALRMCGIEVDYSEKEYHAFCSGFAAIEYTSLLVREKIPDTNMVIANTKRLLIDKAYETDLELASNHKTWVDTHPNTYGVMADVGVARGESMKQLQARAIGAHVASELWMEHLPY